jgi:hypothetical protein
VTDPVLRELEAARELIRRSRGPAAILLRLSRDRAGTERLETERVEGLSACDLLDQRETIAET